MFKESRFSFDLVWYLIVFPSNRFSNSLRDVFAVHYTIQFAASGLVVCITAFQLSVVNELSNGLWGYLQNIYNSHENGVDKMEIN